MRNLNLGPDTKAIISRYEIARAQGSNNMEGIMVCASAMAKILERWMEVGWCWVCAAPASVCSGPHVRVSYKSTVSNKPLEVIEPIDKVGETFPDVPYTIIKS